jgi:hypothetical protein
VVTPPPVLKLRGIGVEEGSSPPSVSKSGAVEVVIPLPSVEIGGGEVVPSSIVEIGSNRGGGGVIPLPGVGIGVERGRLLLRRQNRGQWRWRGGVIPLPGVEIGGEVVPSSIVEIGSNRGGPLPGHRTHPIWVRLHARRVQEGVSKPFVQNGDVFLFIIS